METPGNIGKIKFRAFKAIEDKDACERYLEGHQKVLRIFDIANITSAKPLWIENPNCYVIMAESSSGDKVYGGARVQIADGTCQLPIEEAVSELDPNIHSLVKRKAVDGTGELCGLWNSREVAGLGIGSIFLGRTSISIVSQLNLKSLFALCAPATLRNCLRSGFEVERTLGNNGSFYYPKLDLIATALLMHDPINLPTANNIERENIYELRKNPQLLKKEEIAKGNIYIEYNLSLENSMQRKKIYE